MRRLVLVSLSPACLPYQPPQTALHLQVTLQQKPALTKRALPAGSSIKTSRSQNRHSLQNTLSCHLHKRELSKTDGATQRCLCLGQRMLISWHRHLEPLCFSQPSSISWKVQDQETWRRKAVPFLPPEDKTTFLLIEWRWEICSVDHPSQWGGNRMLPGERRLLRFASSRCDETL